MFLPFSSAADSMECRRRGAIAARHGRPALAGPDRAVIVGTLVATVA